MVTQHENERELVAALRQGNEVAFLAVVRCAGHWSQPPVAWADEKLQLDESLELRVLLHRARSKVRAMLELHL